MYAYMWIVCSPVYQYELHVSLYIYMYACVCELCVLLVCVNWATLHVRFVCVYKWTRFSSVCANCLPFNEWVTCVFLYIPLVYVELCFCMCGNWVTACVYVGELYVYLYMCGCELYVPLLLPAFSLSDPCQMFVSSLQLLFTSNWQKVRREIALNFEEVQFITFSLNMYIFISRVRILYVALDTRNPLFWILFFVPCWKQTVQFCPWSL